MPFRVFIEAGDKPACQVNEFAEPDELRTFVGEPAGIGRKRGIGERSPELNGCCSATCTALRTVTRHAPRATSPWNVA